MEKDFIVSVMDVHQENLQQVWPGLVFSIQNSSFVGIDCVIHSPFHQFIASPSSNRYYGNTHPRRNSVV